VSQAERIFDKGKRKGVIELRKDVTKAEKTRVSPKRQRLSFVMMANGNEQSQSAGDWC
jgi:hypothetical protein